MELLSMLSPAAAAVHANPDSGMNTLVLGALIAIYMLGIGYLGYRGFRKTRGSQDYLLAGRSVNPFVMAMSYGAAFISTSALVGFGGIAGQFGMGLMWLVFMNIAIGIVGAFIFFGRRTRRMGLALDAHTFPEFMGNRFQSRGLKIFLALIIFLFMPLYSSVVLIGGARFLQEVMMVDYGWALGVFAVVVAFYVVFGGLKGVMYVDALMGTVMIVGMLSLLVMWVLYYLLPVRPTWFILSVCGALAHNIGQLLGAGLIISSSLSLYYAPVMLVLGLVMGALTSITLKALLPALGKMGFSTQEKRGE